MKSPSFSECFCEQEGIPASRFAEVVVWRSLYAHARLVKGVLTFFNPGHFAADYDFVHAVGRIRRARDFTADAGDFSHHPANVGFLRRGLRLRVSSKKLRGIVRAALHAERAPEAHDDGGTAVPFLTGDAQTEAARRAAALREGT